MQASRRAVIGGAASLAAAGALLGAGNAVAASAGDELKAIPELAPQWKKLDLAAILKKPAAFASVSQNNSLYQSWGAQASEKHWERGSLAATVKAVKAARKASNFKSFSWIGYSVFRENYPQSEFDRVQYETWISGLNFSGRRRKRITSWFPSCESW